MKRILIALLIAVVGIALSWFFLRPQELMTSGGKDRVVIAHVMDLRNDVNRQEEGRLLWSPIRKGDEIYLGDKIKTAGLSSTVLKFSDSASKLEIEENSTIVMSQGGKKLALNMLEGRVFIKQEEGSGSDQNLDLLSGGKKLDLKGNAAISVSQDGGSQVESFGGESIFGELKPSYSEEILSTKETLSLQWKVANRNDKVEVLLGESPKTLKKVSGAEAAFNAGKLDVKMFNGVNYWQLVAGESRSPIMKVDFKKPLPPSPLYPADKELIKAGDRPFDFKWIKGNAGDNVVIDVAKDQAFSQMMFSSEIKDQTFFTPNGNLPQGEYFWRVKSRIGKTEWVESKTISFTIHQGSNLLSPSPLFPADNAVFYIGKNPVNNVKFEWRNQENIRGYDLRIQGDNLNKDAQVAENSATVNVNRIGKYTWEVYSEGRDGKKSVLPVKRKFEVREEGIIQWNMPQRNFMYLDSLPIVILRWEKRNNGLSILKISPYADLKDAESFQVQGRDFPYRVLKDGIYFAKVSSLDENGTTSAESDILEFKVQEAPLPPAPMLLGQKKTLRASPQGELRTQVENTKPNWLVIASFMDAQGRVVDERRFSDDKLSFSGLMPGKYTLQMKFQDEYRRLGELSERIDVEVPEKSMIAAPKIKGIKVR
jgi:preprotein translocase subunit YajC